MTALQLKALDGEILPPGASVRVIGRTHPLSGGRVELELEAGLSIAEILERCAGSSYAGPFAVYLGEHPIAPENYRRIRVKPGAVVTFFPRLQGGDIWKTVLGVVIAVAAMVVAPWAVGLIGLTGLAATLATAAIAGGVMLAGTLALNALFPVRPPAQASQNNVASASLNSIQGAQNQSAPFGTVPVVLGRHRQSPFNAAKPYTEIVGDDQWLRLLFCLGYGPLAIEDMRIGETPLTDFSDYQVEVRQGFAGDAPVTLYPGSVDEQQLQILLDNASNDPGGGAWNSQISAAAADELSLDFTATEGVYYINKKTGNLEAYELYVAVRYRLVGSGGWTDGGSVLFTRSISPTRRGAVYSVPRGQYEVQCRKLTGNGDPEIVKGTVYWSALRSIKVAPPIGFAKPLALVALRIRASDQLSGVVNTFNCVTTSLVDAYSGAGSSWAANTASQNPADLFRHVLQGPANARPQPTPRSRSTTWRHGGATAWPRDFGSIRSLRRPVRSMTSSAISRPPAAPCRPSSMAMGRYLGSPERSDRAAFHAAQFLGAAGPACLCTAAARLAGAVHQRGERIYPGRAHRLRRRL
jgi:predicted phage tail protein